MTDQQESMLINADACDIREVLWQVQNLAEWNPAFLSIAGSPTARIGDPHQIRIKLLHYRNSNCKLHLLLHFL